MTTVKFNTIGREIQNYGKLKLILRNFKERPCYDEIPR